jgi:hypothetical protein
MQAALHGGAAIWRPSIAFECARAAMLLIRARAVVDVASDGTSNSATRRDEIFIVWSPSLWISRRFATQQPRQTLLILRSTFASSSSRLCWDTDVDVGTSAASGWRWPTGADQGVVVVSSPLFDEGIDGADASTSAVPRPTTVISRR